MLTHLIPHPGVFTAVTTRDTSTLDALQATEIFSGTTCVSMTQVHRADFVTVHTPPGTEEKLTADGLITTTPGLTLVVRHADCLPILVYHPKGVIAAIHAGRRSTQQLILKKVLRHLKKCYALQGSLYLWFGPALCTSCHTINQEKTHHFNLYKENRLQAESVFSPEQLLITSSNDCTLHTPQKYYSYRAEGPGVPMNMSAITLRVDH